MRKIELNIFPKENYVHVTQVGQFIDVGFAFVDKDYSQIMQDVKCKDFMNVPNWQRKTGEVRAVYGWTYDFKKTPYDVDTTRISMHFSNKVNAENFAKNITHLNEIEVKYNITPTEMIATQDPKIYVVEGDTVWQSNCWKMSMYMMYLRRMAHKDFTKPDPCSSDHSFMTSFNNSRNAEHNMLTNIHNNYDHIETLYGLGTAHSSSGAMNILNMARYIDKNTGKVLKEYAKYMTTGQMELSNIVGSPNPDFKMKEAA